ncbi:hypothetical protein [Xanthomonas citri]|uniref:hypothetical protein n=3 Tax=Xanthomonas citri TaxID=346 RepID=UPI000CCE3EB6|nr:hypothetical protein [Xanthomonas citri]PNV26804.1 hypothetical protein xavtCFBP7764_21610 [Xanthomonas citri]
MSRLRAIIVGLGGGVIVAGGLTAAIDAGAVYCCDPWGQVGYNSFVSAGNAVVGSITDSTTVLVVQIQTGVMISWSSGFSNWAQEIGKATASQKTLAEGANAAKTQLYAQDKIGQAQEAAVEAASADSTITSALMLADQDQTQRKAVRVYGQSTINDLVLSPYESSVGKVSRRHQRWCSDAEVTAGLCATAAAPGMQMADTDIATVLDPVAGKTYSDEGRDAAMDYVRNIVSSEHIRTQPDINSPQAQVADGITLADQAALSVAAYSFNSMMADRTRRNQTESE